MDTIPPAPRDGMAAGMPVDPEASRREAERLRERRMASGDAALDRPPAGNTFAAGAPPIGPAPRYGYDQAPQAAVGNPSPYYSAPMADGASNYPAAPGGYRPENLLRRDDLNGQRAQNRLRTDGTYEVQPNDSYWTISERVYGSGAYFRALAEQNRGKAARPDRLPPGLVISTPPVAQLEKDYPDLCPRPNRRDAVRERAAGAASLVSMTGAPAGGPTLCRKATPCRASPAMNWERSRAGRRSTSSIARRWAGTTIT